jgi:alpha-tubulin suppressor-like RCC1 family protein
VLTGVKTVAMSTHTCALMANGGLRCWGYNEHGQLGDGTTTNRATPPEADLLTGVKAMGLGYQHTCVVLDTSGVRCWGDNQFG